MLFQCKSMWQICDAISPKFWIIIRIIWGYFEIQVNYNKIIMGTYNQTQTFKDIYDFFKTLSYDKT